jgi:dihydroceramidase
VYHQILFALLALTIAFRTIYLVKYSRHSRRIPDEVKSTIARVFITGFATFVFGFGIWNIDNIFCDHLTRWKVFIGWPTAFLLEGWCLRVTTRMSGLKTVIYLGHSWWHIFTVS